MTKQQTMKNPNPYASLSEDELFALIADLPNQFAALVDEAAAEKTAETDPETWAKMKEAFGISGEEA